MEPVEWFEVNALPGGDEYGAAHWTVAPEKDAPFHMHPHYEIYTLLSGNVQIVIEDERFDARPMEMYVFPPGHMHRAEILDRTVPYERAFFYITGKALDDMGAADFPMLNILEDAARGKSYCFQASEENIGDMIRLVDAFLKSEGDEEPAARMLRRCWINTLSAQACRIVQGRRTVTHRPEGRISEVIQYINRHLTEPLSLDALSDRFYISKYSLLHDFKNYANISVHQYILSKRVLYAQQLMQEGDAPGLTARRCGFNDYAGFYRAFTRQVKISPQQYYALTGGGKSPRDEEREKGG